MQRADGRRRRERLPGQRPPAPGDCGRVGGIQDQIVDGESGLLLDDPTDLGAFAGALDAVLGDEAFAARLGAAARERVRDRYLGDRHLMQYVDLFERLYR